MNKLIFVSGVHGVGKSTLCKKLNEHVDIPSFSCSEIIKANSEYVETSKVVDKAEANQIALLNGLSTLRNSSIFLDGHFCLIGKDSQIIELDFSVFEQIAPALIINVIAEPDEIHRRLVSRDGDSIGISLIESLQKKETSNAHAFGNSRSIPVIDYVSGADVSNLLKQIK
ncbi:TPA: ATP-binding protein [Vibrio cholerae]|uniref:ATP-binding protein n=1 Tax=Vibrio cholerae TaxID=666 RepID=UPI0011D5A58F|nr:ATP-binding protein [Vibrio cholerae]EGR2427008.1 AAA family ATPase [Vibrio cholerae]EJL6290771.1 AAA family ATPase [Vibrio cholerae]ELJ8562458.1 AAA family ATPase [Vibrio cholerae]TXZ70631.1 AAA family ATPase [Vibrio cholerae]GHZ77357.1 AAA family ATPase [Vibrio cholerae]